MTDNKNNKSKDVFISSIIGMYIIDQFMLQGGASKHVPSAFMDNPTF